jgi:hypothetical protein
VSERVTVPGEDRQRLNRREAVHLVIAALGGVAFSGGSGLVAAMEAATAVTGDAPPGVFTVDQVALLDEIAETILPATGTPGAKAAKTGIFMARMVTDVYSSEEQVVFLHGMQQIDTATRLAHQVPFMQATPAQRLAVLTELDREQKLVMDARAGNPTKEPAHYFRMMKELSLFGYFTSEIGCTQANRFIETPGRYDPCLPYAPGERAWALHA